ncbi:MAG: hypothetical protein SFV23_24080 [Planctomycetaceae bacterium]|nr:hypothetical protein [Planctomycetaceae bacterium]
MRPIRFGRVTPAAAILHDLLLSLRARIGNNGSPIVNVSRKSIW